jgi:hypothetical protein
MKKGAARSVTRRGARLPFLENQDQDDDDQNDGENAAADVHALLLVGSRS